ncbi:MAG TPA: AMIN domain-containing protein [bacterium]|nr:AMIN domain-containing protein [bacterium]
MKRKMRLSVALGLPLLCAALLGAACPKQKTGVEAGPKKKGATTVTEVSMPEANQVEIKGSSLLEGYPFLIPDPLRIGVDVKDAQAALDLPSQISGSGVITNIEVKSLPNLEPPVVRVIATVNQNVTYELKNRGMSLVLVLEPKEGPVAEEQPDASKILPYDETKKELERMLSGAPPPPMSPSPAYSGARPAMAENVPQAKLRMMPPPNGDGSANAVGDILYRTTDDGVQILIVTNGSVARFADYDVPNPPRLVVDFQGMTVATPKYTYPVSWGGVSQVRLGKHPGMARVVVDFRGKMPAYSVKRTESGVSITVFKAGYVPGGVDCQYYTTGAGESLRDVARKVYGNPEAWVTIMSANRGLFKRSELEEMRKNGGSTILGEAIKLKVPNR